MYRVKYVFTIKVSYVQERSDLEKVQVRLLSPKTVSPFAVEKSRGVSHEAHIGGVIGQLRVPLNAVNFRTKISADRDYSRVEKALLLFGGPVKLGHARVSVPQVVDLARPSFLYGLPASNARDSVQLVLIGDTVANVEQEIATTDENLTSRSSGAGRVAIRYPTHIDK